MLLINLYCSEFDDRFGIWYNWEGKFGVDSVSHVSEIAIIYSVQI